MPQNVEQNRYRSTLSTSLRVKRPLFEIASVFIPLICLSHDVITILSRMQNILVKLVQLVGEVITYVAYFMGAPDYVPFYLCGIIRFVVIYT